MSPEPFDHPQALSLLLDACGQAVLAVEPGSLEIRFANAEAGRLLDCAPQALRGRPITEIETGLADHFFWEEVQAGTANELTRVEARYRGLRGQVRPVERSVRRCQIAGRTYHLITVRDLTEQRAGEDLAARTASLLSATLESMADGILVLGTNGTLRNINRRLAELFALSGATEEVQILAALRAAFRHAPQWDGVLASALATPLQHQDHDFELADGRVLECAVRPQMLHGQAVGLLFCFLDITDRTRYQRALLDAKEAADHANRAKSQFLSSMSHELKTPLNAILGFTELLELDRHPGQEEGLRTIRHAGDHLLSLINEVLDLARIEAGRIELQIQRVEVAEALRQAVAMSQPMLDRHGVSLANAAPEAGEAVMADPLRLRQILINLISNAAKYNRPGGDIRIQVASARLASGPALAIAIMDNGIGIAEQDLPRLFQPFNRMENGRERAEGTGLGLALTRRLAELMRGEVRVESALGYGSTFQLLLPAG